MRLGIFAKTFSGTDPWTVLGRASASGFGTVQYNMACSGLASMPDAIPPETAAAVRAASAATGVEIAAVSGTYNMIHPDPAERENGHARLAVIASACAAMGTGLITLCTGTRDPVDQWRGHPANGGDDAWRDLIASMETALGIAGRYGIDLGIEPELANVVDSAEKARRLIDDLQSPRVKIVLDPANLFEQETPERRRDIVSAAIDRLADRIALCHAKDRDAAGGFATAGKGVLDYRHYLGELRRIGFDGPLITHGLAEEEAAGVAAFLRRSLDAPAEAAGR